MLTDVANKIALTEGVPGNAAVDFIRVSGTGNEINEIINNTQSKSKKRKPAEWKQIIAKRQRSLGQEYLGKKLVGKWVSVMKPERKMGQLCIKETCIKITKRFCNEFSEEDCQKVLTNIGTQEIIECKIPVFCQMLTLYKKNTVIKKILNVKIHVNSICL